MELLIARVLVWGSRILVTLMGLIILVGGLAYFWSGRVEYLPGLVVGLLYLWPFRAIKRTQSLNIYWRILWPTSLAIILVSWIGAIFATYSRWWVLVDTVALIINMWAVSMYVRYRTDQTVPNMFLPAKVQLLLTGVILSTLVALGVYWAGGKYESESGTKWWRLDGLSALTHEDNGWTVPVWAKGAWGHEWKISYSNETRTGRVNMVVESPLKKRGYFMFYENGRKMAKVTYEEWGLRRISVFDQESGVELVSHDKTVAWRRTSVGEWVPKINDPRATNFKQDDDELSVSVDYQEEGSQFSLLGRLPRLGDKIKITISRRVDHDKPTVRLLPLLRKNIAWQLGLQEGEEGEVFVVVDGLVKWYR